MNSDEEELYYSCIRFCESFFHLICEKEKLRRSKEYFNIDTRKRVVEFEEERLKSSFSRLCKAVDKIREEKI